MSVAETCLLCKDGGRDDPIVVVGEKGLNTLIRFSQIRNDEDLEEELKKKDTVTVHVACRRDYTNSKRTVVENPMESPKKKRLRSSVSFFDNSNTQ